MTYRGSGVMGGRTGGKSTRTSVSLPTLTVSGGWIIVYIVLPAVKFVKLE